MSFEKAKAIYFDAWINSSTFGGNAEACRNYIDSLKISQHELRLEVNLSATATNFKFALTNSDVNTSNLQFLTETRLTLQDTMVANEYGITIGQTTGQNDANWQQRTYPNTQDFAAADVILLNNLFYSNGSFRMTCNNDVIIPNRGLWNHLYRGQSQQTAALGANSPQDQVKGSEDAMITWEPNILLIGSKGYIPEIILKSNLTGLTNTNIRAILTVRGVLAQNSTSVS